jgi:hypothetical protein
VRASVPGRPAPLATAAADDVDAPNPTVAYAMTAVLAAFAAGLAAMAAPKSAGVAAVVTFIAFVFVLRGEVAAFLGVVERRRRLGAAGITGSEGLLLAFAGVDPDSEIVARDADARWSLFDARPSALRALLAGVVPRLMALLVAGFALDSRVGDAAAAQGIGLAIFGLGYMIVLRGAVELVEFLHAARVVGTARRRSRWFVIGMIAGALFFLVNDQMKLVPLSITEAIGFDSEKTIAAIETSGVLENVNSTFSFTKDKGLTHQAPTGPGQTPGMSAAEWTLFKDRVALAESLGWFVDLVTIAAAAGLMLNTIMVRFLGFAETGELKSDD